MKIGAFTFGGGYAMLPLICSETEKYGWISRENLINFIAVSESTPGPLAVNTATYIGRQTGGIFGGFCATLGVVLPSFVIILIIAGCYENFKNNKIINGCMRGLRPAVIGLVAAAAVSVGQASIFGGGFGIQNILNVGFAANLLILAVTAYLAFCRKLHPIALIFVSAAFGILFGYLL